MPYPDHGEGFAIKDQKAWDQFHRIEFPLKKFEDRDIDVAIEACGVCGSDVHAISGGWGDMPLPLVVGHEVVGKAVKVGKDVTTIKVGDRVGVGAQVGSDLTCRNCKVGEENYCPNMVDTWGSNWPDGTATQGGFSNYIRAHELFTFPIPDDIESSLAAPMLCAGITVYSPLKRLGCGPGKKVAISGMGGLGHFAVLFAAAMGAEVYVISTSSAKKDDALKMGAKHFLNSTEKGWEEPYAFTFDFILNASNATDQFELSKFLGTMKVGGTFHTVGIPNNPLPELGTGMLMGGQHYIGSSHLGNHSEMLEMFELASKKKIKSWVETIDINEKGCAEAVKRLIKHDVRYRFTLVGYDKVFGKRA